MESTFNDFESVADSLMFEDQQLGIAIQTLDFPGGEDGDDEEEEDKSKDSDADNPPLDEEVVQSPLTGQTGGKPGNK